MAKETKIAGFDSKKFLKTKWAPRMEDVPVPDLSEFFDEGVTPVWKIRGLTGQELGRANEAADRSKSILAAVEAIAGGGDKERAQAVAELLGVAKDTPQDVAKRIQLLVMGSVEPACNPELAVRLCEAFPVEFYQITTAIMKLTGQGQMPGKARPSGETQGSATPSPSATSEGASSTT